LQNWDCSGVERAFSRLVPPVAYKHRLRAIVKTAPLWVMEEVLSVSECIGDDGAAVRNMQWKEEPIR
jgi:hypothetical protein